MTSSAGDRVVTSGNHELAALFVQGVLKLSEEATRNVGLELAEIDVRRLDEVVRVNGHVVALPDRLSTAAARVAGRVESIHVIPSERVEAGQVLATVSSIVLMDTARMYSGIPVSVARARGVSQGDQARLPADICPTGYPR